MKFSLLLYEVGGQLHVTNPNPMMTIYLGGERAVLDYLKAFICPCHAASIINGGEFWTDRVQNSNCLFVFFFPPWQEPRQEWPFVGSAIKIESDGFHGNDILSESER